MSEHYPKNEKSRCKSCPCNNKNSKSCCAYNKCGNLCSTLRYYRNLPENYKIELTYRDPIFGVVRQLVIETNEISNRRFLIDCNLCTMQVFAQIVGAPAGSGYILNNKCSIQEKDITIDRITKVP